VTQGGAWTNSKCLKLIIYLVPYYMRVFTAATPCVVGRSFWPYRTIMLLGNKTPLQVHITFSLYFGVHYI